MDAEQLRCHQQGVCGKSKAGWLRAWWRRNLIHKWHHHLASGTGRHVAETRDRRRHPHWGGTHLRLVPVESSHAPPTTDNCVLWKFLVAIDHARRADDATVSEPSERTHFGWNAVDGAIMKQPMKRCHVSQCNLAMTYATGRATQDITSCATFKQETTKYRASTWRCKDCLLSRWHVPEHINYHPSLVTKHFTPALWRNTLPQPCDETLCGYVVWSTRDCSQIWTGFLWPMSYAQRKKLV